MASYKTPKIQTTVFNPNNYKTTIDDVIESIDELHCKYSKNINDLKTQIDKLTLLVYELQKINMRVDDKTTEICTEILQIKENTGVP